MRTISIGYTFHLGLILAAILAGTPVLADQRSAPMLVLSGTSVNLDSSTRALAAGLDGRSIRHARRVLDGNPTRVEATIARHNLCLAWMGQGDSDEAAEHCRLAAAADLRGIGVARKGEFYEVEDGNAAAGTEALETVIDRNLAASLERLDAGRVASSSEAGPQPN